MCARVTGVSFAGVETEADDSIDTTERTRDNKPRTYTGQQTLYSCTECRKQFTSDISLKSHTATNHRGKYKCIQCAKCFRNPLMLRMHTKTHSKQVEAHSERAETDHSDIITEHPFDDKPSSDTGEDKLCPCYVCGKQFASLYSLKFHGLRSHRGKCQYPAECGKSSSLPAGQKDNDLGKIKSDNNEMTRHADADKPGMSEAEKLYPCTQCEKQFASLYSLKFHCLRLHKGKREYPAECGNDFRSSSPSAGQKRNHFGKSDNNEMTRHADADKPGTSEGDKLYACSQCGKQFVYRFMLNFHMKSHGGKYKCSECGKGLKKSPSIGNAQPITFKRKEVVSV